MTPYTTKSGVKIGSRFEPKQHAHTTYSEDAVQLALLEWARRSANDSVPPPMASDFHPLAEQKRKRAERRERARKKRGFLRRFVAMLLSPRAPKF